MRAVAVVVASKLHCTVLCTKRKQSPPHGTWRPFGYFFKGEVWHPDAREAVDDRSLPFP